MKVYIENQILEYENQKNQIDIILKKINEVIENSSKILSHMVIDNIEIYEDYYSYFLDNINVIKKVEVILHTYKELVNDILVSTWEYIQRILSKVEELANNFYKSPDNSDWKDLNDFIGGLSWIINTFTTIDQNSKLKDVVSSYEDWNLYAQEVFSLQEIFPDFEEALSNNDYILIADILSYEILPMLNQIAEKLLELIKVEGSWNGIN